MSGNAHTQHEGGIGRTTPPAFGINGVDNPPPYEELTPPAVVFVDATQHDAPHDVVRFKTDNFRHLALETRIEGIWAHARLDTSNPVNTITNDLYEFIRRKAGQARPTPSTARAVSGEPAGYEAGIYVKSRTLKANAPGLRGPVRFKVVPDGGHPLVYGSRLAIGWLMEMRQGALQEWLVASPWPPRYPTLGADKWAEALQNDNFRGLLRTDRINARMYAEALIGTARSAPHGIPSAITRRFAEWRDEGEKLETAMGVERAARLFFESRKGKQPRCGMATWHDVEASTSRAHGAPAMDTSSEDEQDASALREPAAGMNE